MNRLVSIVMNFCHNSQRLASRSKKTISFYLSYYISTRYVHVNIDAHKYITVLMTNTELMIILNLQ